MRVLAPERPAAAPPAPPPPVVRPQPAVARRRRAVEVGLLLAAPVLAFFLLHLREMATPVLPDPAMHSVYLWDPGDLIRRFNAAVLPGHMRQYVGPSAAYFRWGYRPGFLVPGRLTYLAFGVVPGFLAFRYVLALIAIVPAYLLGKRTYGPGAGALAVCLILASPVVVTAWGTDFPDSAAVSYMLGGLACLAMPVRRGGSRRGWMLGASVLLSAGVWSLATTGVLVIVAVAVVAVQTGLARGLTAMRRELLWLAAGAAAATLLLGAASWLLLGRLDYVLPTFQAVQFLSSPGQTALWHSSAPRWALYDSYLLVLPATGLAWALLGVRRRLPPAAVAMGLIAVLQLTVAAAGQFGGSLQLLEEHYLSSPLWAASLLTVMVVLAELTRPLHRHRMARWFPAALVIAVALLSEAAPRVPAFGLLPWGLALAALVPVLVAAVLWFPRRWRARGLTAAGTGAALAVLAALLVLTVAPNPKQDTHLANTAFDPATGYDDALGHSSGVEIDNYRLEAAVRAAVPNASYRGEQLMVCLPRPSGLGLDLLGLFHTRVNYLSNPCPGIGPGALNQLRSRNVAQLVAMAPDGRLGTSTILAELASLHPRLAGSVTLRSGGQSVQLALIDFPAADGPQYHP